MAIRWRRDCTEIIAHDTGELSPAQSDLPTDDQNAESTESQCSSDGLLAGASPGYAASAYLDWVSEQRETNSVTTLYDAHL